MANAIVPDFFILDKTSGKEIVVVEVKFVRNNKKEDIEYLKDYMKTFYCNIGLLVTPDETVVINEKEDSFDHSGNEFDIKRIRSSDLFGDLVTHSSRVSFESFIFNKLVDLVQEIKEGSTFKKIELISSSLYYLLNDAKVVRNEVMK